MKDEFPKLKLSFILQIWSSVPETISVPILQVEIGERRKVFLGGAKIPGVGTSESSVVPSQDDHSTVPIPTRTGRTV